LRKAESMIRELKAFSVIEEWSRQGIDDALLDRLIYWHDCPAIITKWSAGTVWIKADTEDGRLPTPARFRGFDGAFDGTKEIPEDLLSPHIHWWRREE